MRGKRKTSAGPRCVFNHSCTGLSLTISNVLVTCDTTYRTGLRDNKCALRNFQLAALAYRARAFHIKRNRFWKPESFCHLWCGLRLPERTRREPAEVSLFPLLLDLLPWKTSASRECLYFWFYGIDTKHVPTLQNFFKNRQIFYRRDKA